MGSTTWTPEQLRNHLAREEGRRPMIKAPDAVECEADLHNQIQEDCDRRGWAALHGSMVHRTFRTKGEWDFVILADRGRVFFIEAKDKDGKVSKDQMAMHAWARKLGHHTAVVRSLAEYTATITGWMKLDRGKRAAYTPITEAFTG
jgi:hypothetical protein